jgi:hypothetical protein
MRSYFKRVKPTVAEFVEYVTRNGHEPRVHRVECQRCGKRVWGSGLGTGSHNRACVKRHEAAVNAEIERNIGTDGAWTCGCEVCTGAVHA